MRWLVVHPGPEFSVADVHAGWLEALRAAGEQAVSFTMNDRLTFYSSVLMQDQGVYDDNGYPMFKRALSPEGAIRMSLNGLREDLYMFWPEVVLVVSGLFLDHGTLDMMRDRGHVVVLLHTESPYEDDRQVAAAAHADVNLVNDPTNLESFKAVCPRSYYVAHSYRPGLHKPGPGDPRLKCDLAFAGTGFESRREFFGRLHELLPDVDTLLAGCWIDLDDDSPLAELLVHAKDECLDNAQVVDLYNSSRLGINLYRRESEEAAYRPGWSMGPREVEMAASGLFYLRDPRPEGDAALPMLPTFDGPEDAADKVRYWLARDDERAYLARRARAAVEGRTFDNRCKELLRVLDGVPRRGRNG